VPIKVNNKNKLSKIGRKHKRSLDQVIQSNDAGDSRRCKILGIFWERDDAGGLPPRFQPSLNSLFADQKESQEK